MPKISAHSGLWNACAEAMRVYRREGLVGIKHWLKQVQARPEPNAYGEWIRRYDTVSNKTRAKMYQKLKKLALKPLISVVMPCYNPELQWLKEAIERVRHQVYPHWELCIADDASTDPSVRSVLEDYIRTDSRIRVTFRPTNGHISAASNSALELATGEYIALLDHDDLLAEHALFWVAEAINRNPDASLIYSDEDSDRVRPAHRSLF
ncbi:MAG: glycosyltransferase [Gammaproteobacteria bacterium]